MPCRCADPYFALIGTGFAGECPGSKIVIVDNANGTYAVKITFESRGNQSVQVFNQPCDPQPRTPITGSPFVMPAQLPLWEVALSEQMPLAEVVKSVGVSLKAWDAAELPKLPAGLSW